MSAPGWIGAPLTMLRRLVAHRVVRNAAVLYAVQFSGYIFPLITLPFLSRVLSPEKFGMVAYAQGFTWYFVSLTEYGFNLTATRAIATVRDDPQAVQRIYSSVMAAKFLLTLLGFLICCVTVLSVPALRPHVALFLIAFCTTIGYLLFPMWLYQGLQRMDAIAVRDFASKAIGLVVLFAAVRGDDDYLIAAGAQSGGFLIAGLAGLIPVRRRLGVRFQWPSLADVRFQLKEGWPAFVSLAASTFAAVTNMFILGLHSPAAELAYYGATQRIIAALRGLVSPVSMAVYPHASQMAVRSRNEVIAFVHKYELPLAAPFIAGGVVLCVGAPWLIPLLLGAKYAAAVPVFQLMAFIPALLAFTQVYSTYFMLACGYDKEWMRIILTTVLLNFVVLVPALAFWRGSVALGFTALVAEGSGTFLYWRFYRSRARELSSAS